MEKTILRMQTSSLVAFFNAQRNLLHFYLFSDESQEILMQRFSRTGSREYREFKLACGQMRRRMIFANEELKRRGIRNV